MDKELLCKEIKENAEKIINKYKYELEQRGLYIEKPICGWHYEANLNFEKFKNKVLNDAMDKCIEIMNM
jgi:hypothetical protein